MADDLIPPGFRLRPDAGARLLPAASPGGGAVLAGGSPARVLRLTASGARQVAGWLSGTPVPAGVAARTLARRLLDAGIAHPDLAPGWPGSPVPAEVTVVIPVRDRHEELARCLAGLTGAANLITARGGPRAPGGGGAGPPGPCPPGPAGPAAGAVGAVIVVDDCSADPAAVAAIARAAGAQVIRRPANGGPGAARNTGLAVAATPLVAFLDSDCVPAPGWLDALLPHFADPAVGAVAPRIAPHEPGRTWLARYEGASSTLDMGARPGIVRPGARVPYVPGAALVVRRAAAGDGFAAGLRVGEDVDFAWRLAAAGWRVRYEPAAVMGHQHRVRLRAWMARRADYGTSAALLEELHPGSARPLYASWWTVAAWAAALGPAIRSPRGLPEPEAGRLVRLPSPPVPAAAGLVLAGAVTATAITLLARRLSRVTGEGWPAGARAPGRSPPLRPPSVAWRLAARLAGGGTLAAARPLGSAISRTWWPAVIPLAVAVPRLRGPVAGLVLAPPLLDWVARRPPLDPARYAAARLLDDAAYSAGVWRGCLRRRSFRALRPVIGARPSASAPPPGGPATAGGRPDLGS